MASPYVANNGIEKARSNCSVILPGFDKLVDDLQSRIEVVTLAELNAQLPHSGYLKSRGCDLNWPPQPYSKFEADVTK